MKTIKIETDPVKLAKQREARIAIARFKRSSKSVILLAAPFVISYLIWVVYMNPITYLEKVISFVLGCATVIGIYVVEFALFD